MIADKTLIVEEHVALPTDATGETIHRGCMVLAKDGKIWRVRTLMLGEDGWLLDCHRGDGGEVVGRTFAPDDCMVREGRTVEDVLSEFQDATFTLLEMHEAGDIDWEHYRGKLADAVCEYADLIRRMLDGR